MFNLNIILDSPSVICDDGDLYHLMLPDLSHAHHAPGISGLGDDGIDLAAGLYFLDLEFAEKKKRKPTVMYPDDSNTKKPVLDIVYASVPSGHGAYVVVAIVRPNELHRLPGVETSVQDETGALRHNTYSPRVLLRYEGVTDLKLKPQGGGLKALCYPLAGEAYLNLDFPPSETVDVAHIEAGYRACATMIGVTRYITRTILPDQIVIENVPHKSCKSPVIMVRSPKPSE